MKRVSAITVCTLATLTACSRNEPLGTNWTFDPPDQNPEADFSEQGEEAPEASSTITQPEALGAEYLSPKSSPDQQRDFAWRGLRPSLSPNHQIGSTSYRSAPVPIRSERLSQIRTQVLANLNGQPSSSPTSPSAPLTRQAQPLASLSLLPSTASQSPAPAQTAAQPSAQSIADSSPQLISSLQASAGPEVEPSSPKFSDSFQLHSELTNPDLKLDEVVLFSDNSPRLIRSSSSPVADQSAKPDLLVGRQSEATSDLLIASSTAAVPPPISPNPMVEAPKAVPNPSPSGSTASSQPSQPPLGSLQASSSMYLASVSEEILANNQLDLTQFVFSDRFTLHGLPLHSPAFWLPETSSTVCFKAASEQGPENLTLARLRRLVNKSNDAIDCLGNNRYLAQIQKD
ncbi:MAG: hypothetical protein MJA27_32450 [Pseudanabaenales cyanobacterium]|nr:hypothetical protein [Pseudanabaenales cyanobacterium]